EYFSQRRVHLLLLPEDTLQFAMATPGIKISTFRLIPYHTMDKMAQTVTGDDSPGNCKPPELSPPEAETDCEGTDAVVSKVDALVAVIRTLDWTELTLVYDKTEEMVAKDLSLELSALAGHTQIQWYDLSETLDNRTAFSGEEDNQLRDLLNKLYTQRSGKMRMVLLCSVSCITRVLTAASEFDARSGKKTALSMVSRWLLVLPPEVATFLENCDLELDNVAVIIPPAATYRVIRNVTQELRDLLTTAHEMSSKTTANLSSLAEAIEQLLNPLKTCRSTVVKTLLWKTDGRRLSHAGIVSPNGSFRSDGDLFPNTHFGLNQRNYEWTEPADQEWGRLTEDNTWTGLVGLLERQEVDLVVAPLAIQAEREMVMDFIHPYYLDYDTVLLKLPDPDESKWRRLIQLFKPHVHMCIWISLLCVAVACCVMEAVNPFYVTNSRAMLHASDIFWYMYGALLMHGGARLPDSQTGRTMVSAFWLFSMVMAATYSSNLIAFLAVTKDEAPFQTLEGLVEQDYYYWGTTGGAFTVTVFQRSSIPVFKKVWAGITESLKSDPDVLALDVHKHLEKVKAGGYAYIGETSLMSVWLKSECDLLTIKEQFLPMQYAVGLPNNSAYTRMFSDVMLKINDVGLTETWLRKWIGTTTSCQDQGSKIKEAKPVDLLDIQSAFYISSIGITVALLVLGVEMVCRRFQLRPRMASLYRRHTKSAKRTTLSAKTSSEDTVSDECDFPSASYY
ncbi:hypothetical protein BaRGS_00028435, partial [Batillaria attramentaria]